MATLRDIRRRIRSVQSTQKITRAMKLVAAAKLRRAQERILSARPYANKMSELLGSLASGADGAAHPLLTIVPGLEINCDVTAGERTVEVDGRQVSPQKVLMRLLPRPTDLVGKVTGTAMIAVEVEGWKDGERVVHRFHTGMKHEEAFAKYGSTATGYLVGTGAGVFATQFARGQIKTTGVIAPECLEPAESLRLMATLGLRVVHESRVGRALN